MSTFNRVWLTDPNYCDWIEQVKSDEKSARCRLCLKTFALSNMGVRALKSHATSKGHAKRSGAKSSNCLFTAFASNPNLENADKSNESHSSKPSLAPSTSTPGASAIPSVHEKTTTPPTAANKTLKGFIQTSDVKVAEILWTLKIVMEHSSARSTDSLGPLFRRMFHDSEIARMLLKL